MNAEPPAALSPIAQALPIHCNTPDETVRDHILATLARDLPIIQPVKPHDVPAIIVGGGPSAKDELDKVRSFNVGMIFALNGAGLWLQSHGIMPHAVILLDARPHNVKFIWGLDPRVHLFLATMCHPEVYDAAIRNGNPITTWHSATEEGATKPADVIEPRYTVLIAGGTSVGMRALRLVHVLGYRTVHLFGYDSSYAEGDGKSGARVARSSYISHAYAQNENADDEPQGVMVAGRWFLSTPWMIRQADEFQHIAAQLMVEGMNFHVHGDGLLPAIAKEGVRLAQKPEAAQVHPLAFIGDDVKIGARTRVWQFASVIRGAVLGRDCSVASGVTVDGARFGDRCIIGQGVTLCPGVLFGNDVFVGPNSSFCNDRWPSVGKEGFDIERLLKGEWTIIVKDGASIGCGAIILPGVTIGAGAMVAAGAVVSRSIPDGHLFTRAGHIRMIAEERCLPRIVGARPC